MRARLVALAVAVVAVMAGLSGCATRAPATVVTIGNRVELGTGLEFRVQVATTDSQQSKGLMGRDKLDEGTGMLFPFPGPGVRQVWMAGMKMPIDIAWIGGGKVLLVDTLGACKAAKESNCQRWSSPRQADSLLEVPAGALRGVKTGASVSIVKNVP